MRRAARALASLAALVTLVAGIPLALVLFVGWPLPTAWPTWMQLSLAARSVDIPDALVVKGLACMLWIAWADLAVGVTWEAAVNLPRVTRGREPRRAPLVNRHLAGLATQLFAGFLAVSTTTLHAAGPALAPIAITAPPPRSLATTPAIFTTADVSPVATTSRPVWVAQRGDTLWQIARTALGDPERVADIVRLNEGMLERPRDLRPGMAVVLPADARVPPDRESTAAPAPGNDAGAAAAGPERLPAGTHIVVEGESMWTIAGKRVADVDGTPQPANSEIAPYWAEVVDENRQIPNPNLIYAGEALNVPALNGNGAPAVGPPPPSVEPTQPAPPPARQSPTPVLPASPTTKAPGSGPAHAIRRSLRHKSPESRWALPAGLTGATALASWGLAEVRRRRNRQLRHSKPGAVLPPPDPTVAPLATALHANAKNDEVERLEAALRHLAMLAADKSLDIRPQIVMRRPDGTVEILLREELDPPVPEWQAIARGRVWALDGATGLPPPPDIAAPCPALVQLGTCDDGAELYADIEALGTLSIGGAAEVARQIARALCATLAVSPAARLCRILTYGFDPYGLDALVDGRLVVASDVEALIAEASSTARPVTTALDRDGIGSSFQLRAAAPDEGWEPAIAIIAGGSFGAAKAEKLSALAGEGGRGAAVVVSGIEARWVLEIDETRPGWWTLAPLGIPVQPVGLAADELRDLATYLADADAEPVKPEPVSVDQPVVDLRARGGDEVRNTPSAGEGEVAPTAPVTADVDWRVMVRLLGPPDLMGPDGKTTTGERGSPLELLAWLVTHRTSATRTSAAAALWSGREIAPRTLTNTISAARLMLRDLAGTRPEDGDWIAMHSEHLKLAAGVISDHEFLCARLNEAKQVSLDRAAVLLADCLPLLRGAPLAGQAWLWADEDFVASKIAVTAVTVTCTLAKLRLDTGDPIGALQATDAGLQIIPGHEELICLAMQARADSGDRQAALAVYADYEHAVAARDETVGSDIARLRNQLLRIPAQHP